jgi:hypothetical protein
LTGGSTQSLLAGVDVAEELGIPADQVVDAIDAAANGVPASRSMVQRARQQMVSSLYSLRDLAPKQLRKSAGCKDA